MALVDVNTLDRHACRAAVDARFSMERMAADHLDFYRDVLAERRGASPERLLAVVA